jgi:hypothetical protein
MIGNQQVREERLLGLAGVVVLATGSERPHTAKVRGFAAIGAT